MLPQPFEGQRQERPPLGIAYIVDLVQYDPFHILERLLELGGRQYECETLGGRDEDVRRMTDHLLPLVLRGVSGPDCDPDVGDVHAVGFGDLPHLGQWCVEVAVDIVGQGLEGRYIDAIHPLLEGPLAGITCEFVDYTGESREGLS